MTKQIALIYTLESLSGIITLGILYQEISIRQFYLEFKNRESLCPELFIQDCVI